MALTQNSYFVSFEAVKVYNWIVNFFFFYQISTVTGELRYGDALRLLYMVEEASKG